MVNAQSKRVRTLESFFTPNQSQSESEKNVPKKKEHINQEETDEGKETEKITNFPENLVARSHIRWVPETFHARFPRSVKSYK